MLRIHVKQATPETRLVVFLATSPIDTSPPSVEQRTPRSMFPANTSSVPSQLGQLCGGVNLFCLL